MNGNTELGEQTFKASYTKFHNQTTIEAMQELNNWFQNESARKVNQLPHLGAVIELWELVTVTYNVGTIKAVIELIESGKEDHSEWDTFVSKYQLDRHGWEYFIINEGKLINVNA